MLVISWGLHASHHSAAYSDFFIYKSQFPRVASVSPNLSTVFKPLVITFATIPLAKANHRASQIPGDGKNPPLREKSCEV